MSRYTDLQRHGEDLAEAVLQGTSLATTSDERKLILGSALRAILGTGLVTLADVDRQLSADLDLVDGIDRRAIGGGK